MADVYVVVVINDGFTKSMVETIAAFTNLAKAIKVREKAQTRSGRRAYLQRVWIE